MNRRNFISGCLTCSAHILALANFAPISIRNAFTQSQDDKIVAKENWGQLEMIAEGVWVLISTPFTARDFTTVCNGGIIAGDKGVLAVESFMQPKGAKWLAEKAKELTGRWPTDVVSTHFHADHSAGHKGYFENGQTPRMWLTESTRSAAEKAFDVQKMTGNEFQNVSKINSSGKTTVDLGNRKIELVNRSGHTTSDVTIEVLDPNIVWCGDLFFNRMFPNYGDATPSKLIKYAKLIEKENDTTYVPGHGPVADRKAIKAYQELLNHVEQHARTSHQAGNEVEDASKQFQLPDSLKDWIIWSPDVTKRAMNAWYRELSENSK